MKPYSLAVLALLGDLRRDRRRASRADRGGGRRRGRVRPRRALHRARRRALHARAAEDALDGPQDPRARAGTGCAVALRDRVRRDRVVALHRARHRRGRGARPDAARAARHRRGVRARLAVVRGRDDRAAGDGRRRDVRATRVQRPRRLRDRLGALPRLPHRHGALGALRPALPRGRARRAVAPRGAVGRRRRLRVDRRDRRRPHCSADAPPPRLARRRAARPARAGRPGAPRARAPALARDARRGLRVRERPGLERPRLRASAGDARLHRARDGREPRRGGDGAGSHASPLALLRDRAGRRRDRADRRDRALRLSGCERADRARRGMARGAARRHRGGVRRLASVEGGRRARGRRRHLRCAHPGGRRHDVVLGHHAPHLLARGARLAASRVRTTRAPSRHLERGDRRSRLCSQSASWC